MEKPSQNDVLRAKRASECGLPVGQMNVKIMGSPRPFDTISFYCTGDKNHQGQCAFVGVDLVVTKRRRE